MNRQADESGRTDPFTVVLVHGYLGLASDLSRLESALTERFGPDSVHAVRLPAHEDGTEIPPFDKDACLDVIGSTIDMLRSRGRRLILLGHSTGGSLLLAEISRRLAGDPGSLNELDLLVLCATPPVIDLGYAQRWASHTESRTTYLHDVGELVSMINRLARHAPLAVPSPVLVVQGEADELVPVAATRQWADLLGTAPQRQVRIANAKHHLFSGAGADVAIDVVCRAIDDAAHRHQAQTSTRLSTLFERVPPLKSFVTAWPDSARHIGLSPAARNACDEDLRPVPEMTGEPTVANIEITTRCNLGCPACARTQLKTKSRFMNKDDFVKVLDHLPHAYRVVLVGLGEPLLHPEAIDFIGLAVASGRRVGLVTNGTVLTADKAQALCCSGLSAITVSLDAVTQASADRARTGCDVAEFRRNVANLVEARRTLNPGLGVSAFTALAADTLDEFDAVVDFAADHQFDALMVSDLNFASNQARSLHQTLGDAQNRRLRKTLRKAVARGLPILSVHALEEFALEQRYLDFLVTRGDQVAQRSTRRARCTSPWQSIPVGVDGDITLCDCQPTEVIGNIHRQPLHAWWNGPAMTRHRQRMLGDDPPAACLACPRF